MSNLVKNLLIAVVVASLLFAGYFFYLRGTTSDVVSTTDPDLSSMSVAEETQRLLELIAILEKIEIDGNVLSDTRFSSLVDFRQDLGVEAAGRRNPFAPLGE